MTDDDTSTTHETDEATTDETTLLATRRELLQAGAVAALLGEELAGPTISDRQRAGVGATDAGASRLVPRRLATSIGGGGEARLGTAVALADETAVVGRSPGAEGVPDATGRVSVVTSKAGEWSRRATLAPETDADVGGFGTAVSVDDDTVVVGAPLSGVPAGPHGGSAAVFERREGGWQWATTLRATVSGGVDRFGAAVTVDGDTALIGAPAATAERGGKPGAVSVFSHSQGSWTQTGTLVPEDGIDRFGRAVALDGDIAVVGARQTGTAPMDSGVAVVYERAGGRWVRQASLVPGGADRDDGFGAALAVDRGRVLVGAPTATTTAGTSAGTAHVFVRAVRGWTHQERLVAENGLTNDRFGAAVALSDGAATVGDHSSDGPAVFTWSPGGWSRAATLASDGTDGRRSGIDVALDAGRALVGSEYGDTGQGRSGGHVEVFEP